MRPSRFASRRSTLLVASLALFSCVAPAARAMSVLPPTFPELVDESARIVRGRVTGVEAVRATGPDGRTLIKTRVTWEVSRTLKGAEATTLTLEFLGGRIGGDSLTVPGMPQFKVGNDDYLFVEPDVRVICPLLAAGHGRYPVKVDVATGRTFVARENGLPLTDVAQVAETLNAPAAPLAARRAPTAAYTPEAFEAHILGAINHTVVPTRNE